MSLEMFNMFCSLRNAMGNGMHLKNPAVRAETKDGKGENYFNGASNGHNHSPQKGKHSTFNNFC